MKTILMKKIDEEVLEKIQIKKNNHEGDSSGEDSSKKISDDKNFFFFYIYKYHEKLSDYKRNYYY